MINDIKIIKNYAVALFETLVSENKKEDVLNQLKEIDTLMNKEEGLNVIMRSPIIKKSDKIHIIQIITKHFKVEKNLQNFLVILVKNSRMGIFSQLVEFYAELLMDSQNIKVVKVTSSKTLSIPSQKEIKNYLEGELKKKVSISFTSDESIVGGIIVRYGSNMIDLSVAGVLERMKKMMSLANTNLVKV